MPSAKDVTVDTEWLKAMLVGETGTGKSTFAASCPTPGFVFDFGSEILSYAGKDFNYEKYPLSAAGWAKFERDFMQVKKDVNADKYQTVVIDNVSALTDLCMEKAMQLDPKRSLTNGPLWNVHYGLVKNMMEGKIHQMLSLECNLIMIAHLSYIKDEDGAVIGVEPSFTGSLSADVPNYFSEVYYHTHKTVGGETKFFIQTIPIGRNHGRSRSSGKARLLPDVLPNDYGEVMQYLTGKKVRKKK